MPREVDDLDLAIERYEQRKRDRRKEKLRAVLHWLKWLGIKSPEKDKD